MSTIDFIHEEKAADIGNFLVGRLLPFRQKRNIGPFVFIDHMGPVTLQAHENLDVAPHPHIGLSTLTYLFDGAIMHRDSLGTALEITPGAVNWMTAGQGVVHSERTPDALRATQKRLHGLQIWVALPKELEQTAPSFAHIAAADLPEWQEENATYKLLAGRLKNHESPVPVYSPLYMLEIKASKDQNIDLSEELFGESGLYILEGSISQDGHTYGEKQILITKNAHLCAFELKAGSTVYLFGGTPFPEERFIYWNFVSSEKEIIEQAKEKWKNQTFDPVPGETTFIPLPQASFKK